LKPQTSCSNFLRSWEVFVIPFHFLCPFSLIDTNFYFSPLVKFMSCDSVFVFVTCFFFRNLGKYIIKYVNLNCCHGNKRSEQSIKISRWSCIDTAICHSSMIII
jgi:hypothetical protein